MQGVLEKLVYKGTLLGNFIQLYTATQLYQGMMNTVLLIGTAYNTTYRAWLLLYFPWISFPIFIGTIVVGQLVMMWFHGKFVLPSVVASSNTWSWQHQNPQRKHFAVLEHNLRKLMAKEGVEFDETIEEDS